MFRDVTAPRLLEEKLTHTAEHDFLTGLPNRMLLKDRVSQAIAIARRNVGGAAVLFLDLDGFKHINDSLGHQIGDKLLQSVATRLLDCVRAPDTVSRLGGDEFVVLIQELHRPEDAGITAGRLLKAVADVHSIDQHEIHLTASIGVSVYPRTPKTRRLSSGMRIPRCIKPKEKGGRCTSSSGRRCFSTPYSSDRMKHRPQQVKVLRDSASERWFSRSYAS